MVTYYVSDAAGDDSRTAAQAQNINTPWKTIGKAVNDTTSADSRTIYVKSDGEYTGTQVQFRNDGTDTYADVTITGYKTTPGDDPTGNDRPRFTGSDASRVVYNNWRDAGFAKFKNFRIRDNGSLGTGAYTIDWTGNATNGNMSLYLENVHVENRTATTGGCLKTYDTLLAATRIISMSNVTFNMPATVTTATCCLLQNIKQLVMDNVVFNMLYNAGGAPNCGAISLSNTATVTGTGLQASITNCSGSGMRFLDSSGLAAAPAGYRHTLRMRNNTFSATTIGAVASYTVIANRMWHVLDIDGFDITANTSGGAAYFAFELGCAQAVAATNHIDRLNFANCSVTRTGTANSGDHLAYVGYGTQALEASGVFPVGGQIHHNTFLDLSAAPNGYGLVVKGDNLSVNHNVAVAKFALYAVSCRGCTFHHNSCYSNAASGFALGYSKTTGEASGTNDPVNNVFEDNLMDGGLGAYALDMANNGSGYFIADADSRSKFDRNVYKAGTSGVWRIDRTADAQNGTTLAGLQARWAQYTISTTFPDNDGQSEVADPRFLSPSTGDLRIRRTSPGNNNTYAEWYDYQGAWGVQRRITRELVT